MAIVGTDAKRLGGQRLKAFVHDRMAAVGISTLVELAEKADVAYDTLHAWFRGRPPTPRAGGRVSQTLGVTYSEMLAAYEGNAGSWFVNEPQEPPTTSEVAQAIREQTVAIQDQTAVFDRMLNLLVGAPAEGDERDEWLAREGRQRLRSLVPHAEQ